MCIEPFRRDTQHIARCLCEQELFAGSVGEESPQPREIDAQNRVDSPWGGISPELLDESLARDRLIRMDEEDGEERALFRTAERDYPLAPDDLKRPEDAELEIRMTLRTSIVRPWFANGASRSVCSTYSSRLAAVLSGA